MVSGIHTADPEHLSLSSTMPQFLEMEQKFGGVIKALIQKRKESVFRNASGPRYSLFLSLRRGIQKSNAMRIFPRGLIKGVRISAETLLGAIK